LKDETKTDADMTKRETPCNADLAAKVLRDVAAHYRAMAEENLEVQERLLQNAEVCEDVARMVEEDPLGTFTEPMPGEDGDDTLH
jgi:hypothetical protein